ncbi:hypothetical protein D9758_015940 [Tetrapyrgos nigripes]|uniref:Uncharacterized protein n=1 Tax=Tetrapyrgos nigripes TaxID=182062 RepID=A0A8H5C815_9AGAR|nr:hypothetical protein D9758_015940 [Tetrapyrgos nigripes]
MSAPTGDIIHLPSVSHLVVRAFHDIDSVTSVTLTLFSHLSLPNLTSLEISQFGSNPNGTIWSSSSFSTMIQNSGSACRLRSLYLDEIQISLEDLIALLRLTPDLTHLTFCEYGANDTETDVGATLFSLLTWSQSSGDTLPDDGPHQSIGILPFLSDIDLRTRSYLDHTLMESICDLIESRTSLSSHFLSSNPTNSLWSGVCTLKYFRFEPTFSGSPYIVSGTEQDMDRFEKLARRSSLSRKAFFVVVPSIPVGSDDEDFCMDSDESWIDSDACSDDESSMSYEELQSSLVGTSPTDPDNGGIDTSLFDYPLGTDLLIRSYYFR